MEFARARRKLARARRKLARARRKLANFGPALARAERKLARAQSEFARAEGGSGRSLPGIIFPMLLWLLPLLLGAPSPLHLADKAFGKPAEIEVRDLPQETAQGLIRRAFAEIAEIERLADG